MVMNEEEIIRLLESIGIRGYEARAYLALIELGEATATMVASKAKIPRPRIYDVLTSLSKKGLVEVKIGRPRIYHALSPEIALNQYIKRYVNEIYISTSRLTKELSKLYSSSTREKEPLIWINYNLESGIEKAKALISNMKYDAILSIDNHILDKLYRAMIKRLQGGNECTLALTLISESDERELLEKLGYIDRIEIRILSTGILKMIEIDLNDALLFGERYVMHTREQELILIIYEIYYFGYWRVAKVIKPLNIKRGEKYILTHHWLAMDVIREALSNGFNVKSKIKGYHVRSRKPIVIEGYVKKIYKTANDVIRSIIIETDEGEVRVGGLGASMEDIESRLIELTIE